MIRIFDWFFLFIVVAAVVWFVLPSSLFIRDISLTVEGSRVQYVRETPFGTVDARWRSEITLIGDDAFECSSGDWEQATYQQQPGNTVTYNLGDWADDCIAAGPPFYLTTTRQVLAYGILPLRQTRQVTEIQGEREAPLILVVPTEQ